jgi:manganese transport protein
MAAAVFYRNGQVVTEIAQAHDLLTPLVGTSIAATAFGIALLCSGQSSTLTGTLAGQVVMEGFVNFHMRPWMRRLMTRTLAIVPAVLTIAAAGAEGTYRLLILSQVILSLQLPFAVVPLIHFTSDKHKMGDFANRAWVKLLAWGAAIVIIGLNMKLVYSTVAQWVLNSGKAAVWIGAFVVPLAVALAVLLLYLILTPFLRQMKGRAEPAAPIVTPGELLVAPYERIAVALEATPRDRAILAQAIPIAKQHGAKLLLIHVAEGMGPRFWKEESADSEVRSDRAYLEQLQSEIHRMGLRVEIQLGFGEPAHEIVRIVEETDAQLLVIGTHGHRFPQDLLLGATVTRVRHAIKIPVFMVPTEKA